MSESLKVKGNDAFTSGKFEEAIGFFTQAIEIDPNNHVLYSNRSGSYASVGKFQEALEDALKTVEIKPEWAKSYSRKGAALFGLQKYADALEAYEKAQSLDPANSSIKTSIEDCHAKISERQFSNPFSSPEAIAKLSQNPKTRSFMSDPNFIAKLECIKNNPKSLGMYLQDPQIMEAFGVILGIDIHAQQPQAHHETEKCCSDEECTKEKKEEEKVKEPSVPEDISHSVKEKELGNQKYKQRDFDGALMHYEKAYELDQTNVSILTNISAVYFEQKKWDECIKKCHDAVNRGRELYSDYKIIAKALARMGNCHVEKNDLESAVKCFQQSLTEFRNPDVVSLLHKTERELERIQRESYRNPSIADEERNKGNEYFKQGKWTDALNHYNESIKRNDQDARNYSNRAACFIKLAAFPEALKDCEKAIELDPKFVKSYVRKANILFFKKDYSKCIECCRTALEIDPNSEDAKAQLYSAYNELNKQSDISDPSEAMNDPEIQSILNDPAMRSILEQMQSNPQALLEHMKNPIVAQKIRKLISSGIIKTR